MTSRAAPTAIGKVAACAYRIPTDGPESDGTLCWRDTTLVLVRATACGVAGVGYGYSDRAAALLIADKLAPRVEGQDAMATQTCWARMAACVRNLGRPGLCAQAISAVDTALWDLKCRLLGVSLADLLGPAREAIPTYGSGGFTNETLPQLREQVRNWTQAGLAAVKIKIGREPAADAARVEAVRAEAGPGVRVMVDANGAYARKQALLMAERFAPMDVCWFEEPVSSDDLDGLRMLRDRAPAGMDIAAGEYAFDLPYLERMLGAQAVDVLQADATRCGGITGWLGAAALCEAHGVPLSSHCAPALHTALCCCARPAVHLEYFKDHERIERLLFDGAPRPAGGRLAPDRGRPGLGLEFKEKDAQCYLL